MQLLGFEIKGSARRTDLKTHNVTATVPAGATRTINFPTEFYGLAVSLDVQNEDGTNAATIQVNETGGVARNIPAGQGRTYGSLPIVQVTIVAGALGICFVNAEIISLKEFNK